MNEKYIGSVEHLTDTYDALDTVRDDLVDLKATVKELASVAGNDRAERSELLEMVKADREKIDKRRDYVLRSLGGVPLPRENLRKASELYVDGHEDDLEEAAHRAYYYNVIIDATATGRPVTDIYTGELVGVKEDKPYTVRLHGGRPDSKGRGTWYNPVAPRTVELVREVPASGPRILGTYEVSDHEFDPVTGEHQVTARMSSTEKKVTFSDNSDHYRMRTDEKSGPVLEHIMPPDRTSIFEYDELSKTMLIDARRKHEEAAQVAMDAAGGPQSSIYETYDTSHANFNPVPVSVGKTQ